MTLPTVQPQRARAETLRSLHTAPELLVLVNVWDVASTAAVAAAPGCTAIATASAAIAAAHGYPDGEGMPVEVVLTALAEIVGSTDLPVTADLEAGYGDVDATIRRAIGVGVVGANLEDSMRPIEESVRAVEMAVAAAAAEGVPIVLNARTDTHIMDTGLTAADRLAEAQRRGTAYLSAGADCIFVPACTDEDEIASLVDTFGPGRLSLIALPGMASTRRLEELGVARLSHGPFAQRHVLAALTDHATSLLSRG